MSRALDVYLHENLVGQLVHDNSGDLLFTYNDDYLEGASYGISLSLPLGSETHKGLKVKSFFSGLLLDESVKERLAKTLGLFEKNPFALLEAVGGDCAGALSLYPSGEKPWRTSENSELLDEDQLEAILYLIKRRPMLAGDDGYRLSLAGAQDKLAVGFQDGKVKLIKDGAPTSHILKLIIDRVKDSAHNELFCMKLAKFMGINVPEASLHFVHGTPYYLVERYDRSMDKDGRVTRIHQEDFCQALGMAPEIKYEREGGPTIPLCLTIIAKHSARPAVDQIAFLNRVIFNYLIGNAHAHGKNFSLLYKGNKPELAPAYDLLTTAIYPDLSDKLAMKIGGTYKPIEVSVQQFHKLVVGTKAAQSGMNRLIQSIVGKIGDATVRLKRDLEGEGFSSPVFDEIIAVIKERSERLKL